MDLSRGKAELIAENALLRQQLIVLRRQIKHPTCTKTDRLLLGLLAKADRTWRQALYIVQPETLLRWHRQAFRVLWKRKSKAMSTRPKISPEVIVLMREMAQHNRLCGAERIRGELLKLDIRVCKRTIQKLELTRKNVVSKVGDQFILDCFACSKAIGLTYCNVECKRTGL